MKKKTKKLLSLICALSLIVSNLSGLTVFAAEEQDQGETTDEESRELDTEQPEEEPDVSNSGIAPMAGTVNLDVDIMAHYDELEAGRQAKFTLEMKSTGAMYEFKDVTVTAQLPDMSKEYLSFVQEDSLDELEMAGVVPEFDPSNNLLTWHWDVLQSGQTHRVIIGIDTENGLTPGVKYNNQNEIISGEVLKVETNLKWEGSIDFPDSAETKVAASPVVGLSMSYQGIDGKEEPSYYPQPAEVQRWNLRTAISARDFGFEYLNPGTNIVVSVALPAGLNYIGSSNEGQWNASNRTVTWRNFTAPNLEIQRQALESGTNLFEQDILLRFNASGLSHSEKFKLKPVISAETYCGSVVNYEGSEVGQILGGGSITLPSEGTLNVCTHYYPKDVGTDGREAEIDRKAENNNPVQKEHAYMAFAAVYRAVPTGGTSSWKGTFNNGGQVRPNPSNDMYQIATMDNQRYETHKFTYHVDPDFVIDQLTITRPQIVLYNDVDPQPINQISDQAYIRFFLKNKGEWVTRDYFSYLGGYVSLDELGDQVSEIEINLFDIDVRFGYTLYILGSLASNSTKDSISNSFEYEGTLKTPYTGHPGGPVTAVKIEPDAAVEHSPWGPSYVKVKIDRNQTSPLMEPQISLDESEVIGGNMLTEGTKTLNVSYNNHSSSQKKIVPDGYSYILLPANMKLAMELTNGTAELDSVYSFFVINPYDEKVETIEKKKAKLTLVEENYQGKGQLLRIDWDFNDIMKNGGVTTQLKIDVSEAQDERMEIKMFSYAGNSQIDIPAGTGSTLGTNGDLLDPGSAASKQRVETSAQYRMLRTNTGMKVEQMVKGKPNDGFKSFGHAIPGATVSYIQKLTAAGTTDIESLYLLDVLPGLNDLGITDNESRGSRFTAELAGPVKLSGDHADKFTVSYSTADNPSRDEMYDKVVWPSSTEIPTDPVGVQKNPVWMEESQVNDWNEIRSYKIELNDGEIIPAGDSVQIEFDLKVPEKDQLKEELLDVEAEDADRAAWNSFALVANNLQPVEPAAIGLVIDPWSNKTIAAGDGYGEQRIRPGQKVTFTIAYQNNFTVPADVTISDKTPEGLQFVGFTGDGGSYDKGIDTVKWTIEGVEPGDTGSVTATYKVTRDVPDSLINQPDVVIRANDDSGNITEQPKKEVDTEEAWSSKKIEDGSGANGIMVTPNQYLTYYISYRNKTGKEADVKIVDQLPAGVRYVESDSGGQHRNGTVTWTLGGIGDGEAGKVAVKVYTLDTITEGEELINTAEVSYAPTDGTKVEIEEPEEKNPVGPPMTSKTAGGIRKTASIWQYLTYMIDYENRTGGTASVKITEKTPEGMMYVSHTGTGGSYEVANDTVTWNFANQADGAKGSVTVTYKVLPEAPATLKNQAEVVLTPNDTSKPPHEEFPEEDRTREGAWSTKEVVQADGDDGYVVAANQLIDYKIGYENKFDGPAKVVIEEKTPEGMEFISAENGRYNAITDTVTWEFDKVEPRVPDSVTVRYRVRDKDLPASIENEADITITPLDEAGKPIPDENPHREGPETSNPTGPGWSSKHVTSEDGKDGSVMLPDRFVTYQIDWSNKYSDPANVEIFEPTPEGLRYSECSEGGQYDEDTDTVTWTLDKVDPGASGSVTVVYEVLRSQGAKITNRATVNVIPVDDEGKPIDSIPPHEEEPGTENPIGSHEKSLPPEIDDIREGDKEITGKGIPGSDVVVTFPDGTEKKVSVGEDYRWSVEVPENVELKKDQDVKARQEEPEKDPSDDVTEKVQEKPNPEKSAPPTVEPVKPSDKGIGGGGVPGAEIEVTWPDGKTGKGKVDDEGKWYIEKPEGTPELKPGEEIDVTQKEPEKERSDEVTRIVDDPDDELDPPVFDDVKEGDRTVSGTGVPGARLELRFPDGQTIKMNVEADGTWKADVPDNIDLKEGDPLTAFQRRGTLTSLPAATVVGGLDKAKETSQIPEIDIITEGDPVVEGRGVPGSKITVTWPDGSETETEVGRDYRWRIDVPDGMTLEEGQEVKAVQTEPGKLESDKVPKRVRGKSQLPEIDPILEGEKKITGRGVPSPDPDKPNTVTVYIPSEDGKNEVVVTVPVDEDGKWEADIPDTAKPLVPGDTVRADQKEQGKKPSDDQKREVGKREKSLPPDLDDIKEGDKKVTGEGVPGAKVVVTFPDGTEKETDVGKDYRWSVDVPENVELKKDQDVTARQEEPEKKPSDDVTKKVQDKDDPEKSAPPTVEPVKPGDKGIGGGGVPGAEIEVTWPDGKTGKGKVDDNGKWYIEKPDDTPELKPDDEIKVKQKEPEKDPSDDVIQIVEDPAKELAPPVFDDVKEGDRKVSGTGEPKAELELRFPDGRTAKVTVEDDGTWEVDVPDNMNLKEGERLTATQRKDDLTSLPAATVVGGLDKATEVSEPPQIDTISEGDPIVEGRGVPGSTIRVTWPDGSKTETVVDKNYRWRIDVPDGMTLKEGEEVNAAQTEPGKKESDNVPKQVRGKSELPEIDPILEGDKKITGRGVPSPDPDKPNTVTVYLPSEDGKNDVLVTVPVDKDGKWEVTIPETVRPLIPGDNVRGDQKEYGKKPSDDQNREVGRREKSLPPDLDDVKEGDKKVTGEGVPGAKVIVTFPDGTEKETVVDKDYRWSVDVPENVDLKKDDDITVRQEEPEKKPSDNVTEKVQDKDDPEKSAPPTVEPVKPGDKGIGGGGVPGAEIEVTWPDDKTGKGKVDDNGKWYIEKPEDTPELKPDDEIKVKQKEPEKDPSDEVIQIVEDPAKELAPPVFDDVSEGDRKVSGTGEPGAELELRFPDGRTAKVTVEDDGTWEVKVPDNMNLKEGERLTATQRKDDLTSLPAATVVGGLDKATEVSEPPQIDTISEGDPIVEGRGVPGSTIKVTWPDGSETETVVDKNYRWRIDVPDGTTLKEGDNVIATQTEPGRKESDKVPKQVRGKSKQPEIDPILEGDKKITGRGVPSPDPDKPNTVTVYVPSDDGKNEVTVTVPVDKDGKWEVTIPDKARPLTPGDNVRADQKEYGKKPSDDQNREVGKREDSLPPEVDDVKEGDKKVTGEGVPGAKITVTFPDGTEKETIVDEDYRWSVDVPENVNLKKDDIVKVIQQEPEKNPSEEVEKKVAAKENPDQSEPPVIYPVKPGDKGVGGGGTPGGEITITWPDGSQEKGDVDDEGKWYIEKPPGVPELKPGDEIKVTQKVPGKDPSEEVKRIVEDPAKDVPPPVFDDVAEGDRKVSGTGVPGAELELRFPDGRTAKVTVKTDGTWEVNVPDNLELKTGERLTATQKKDNVTSLPAATVVGGLDKATEVSEKPVIDTITEGDPIVGGKGVPGSKIVVTWPDGSETETVVDRDYRWKVDVPDKVTLKEGDKVAVVQIEPGKKPSGKVTKDVRGRSELPEIDPITEGDRKVTGKGKPGSEITVYWPDDSGTSKVKVDKNGRWETDVPEDQVLKHGDKVQVVQKEPDKAPSKRVEEPVLGVSGPPEVDDIREGDRKVTGRGTPGAEIEITWPDGRKSRTTVTPDGTWMIDVPEDINLKTGDKVKVTQTEEGKRPSEPVIETVISKNTSSKPKVDPIQEGDRKVTGKGTPGAEIEVTWPDGSKSKGIVDEDGIWSVDVPKNINLKKGDQVSVIQTEPGKDPSEAVTMTVEAKDAEKPGQSGGAKTGGSGSRSVKTGDNARMMLYLSIAGIAILILIVLMYLKKKKYR